MFLRILSKVFHLSLATLLVMMRDIENLWYNTKRNFCPFLLCWRAVIRNYASSSYISYWPGKFCFSDSWLTSFDCISDDGVASLAQGRSRRQKVDKKGRLSAFEKLRQAKEKGIKNKYEVTILKKCYRLRNRDEINAIAHFVSLPVSLHLDSLVLFYILSLKALVIYDSIVHPSVVF